MKCGVNGNVPSKVSSFMYDLYIDGILANLLYNDSIAYGI
jgi:hypothetical protein